MSSHLSNRPAFPPGPSTTVSYKPAGMAKAGVIPVDRIPQRNQGMRVNHGILTPRQRVTAGR